MPTRRSSTRLPDDGVDLALSQWRKARPDVDMSPTAVIGRLSRASRLVERELKQFFAQYGLESWEFDVLATLRRSEPPHRLTAGELLRSAMITSGAITNRIDRLEEKGLVRRTRISRDRRNVFVELAEPGLRLIDEILPAHAANEDRILAALGRSECDQLAGYLRRLLVALGDLAVDPADEVQHANGHEGRGGRRAAVGR